MAGAATSVAADPVVAATVSVPPAHDVAANARANTAAAAPRVGDLMACKGSRRAAQKAVGAASFSWLARGVLEHVNAALGQQVVNEHQQGHGFDHGYRTGKHAGVVAALCFEFYRVTVAVDGLLSRRDRGRWFECGASHDRCAIADAALHATRVIGFGARRRRRVARQEGIIVIPPGHLGASEA